MSSEINLKKDKETTEDLQNILGLVGLTVTIIFIFSILNIFTFGERDKDAESDKAAMGDKSGEINTKVLSKLPKGRLNFFESSEGHKLSASEYKAVCKNTKIVTQRAIMGANIINYKAKQLYTDNGNLIDKYSVKWDSSSKKCFAEYTIRALAGTSDTITVSGEAKGFLKTSIDTRVYFIKNF